MSEEVKIYTVPPNTFFTYKGTNYYGGETVNINVEKAVPLSEPPDEPLTTKKGGK